MPARRVTAEVVVPVRGHAVARAQKAVAAEHDVVGRVATGQQDLPGHGRESGLDHVPGEPCGQRVAIDLGSRRLEEVDRLGRVVGDPHLGEHLQRLLVDELLLVVAQIADPGLGHGFPAFRVASVWTPGLFGPGVAGVPTVTSHARCLAASLRAAKHTAPPGSLATTAVAAAGLRPRIDRASVAEAGAPGEPQSDRIAGESRNDEGAGRGFRHVPPLRQIIPAASYSPAGSPPKYHRRWRA